MIRIIHFFILIRLRKFLGNIDFSSYLIVLAFYFLGGFVLFLYVDKYSYYFLLFSLGILQYHNKRKDIDLLKFRKNYKTILYLEYSIYSLVFTVPLLLAFKWRPFLFYQLLILFYINIPTQKKINYIHKYPFKLLDPFWVISFRKNKLFLSLIPVLFLFYVGNRYGNDNLIFCAYLLIAIVLSIPSFNRENIYFIKVNQHNNYLKQQLNSSLYNSLFLIVPTLLITLIFGEFKMLLIAPLVFIPMVLNILMKYTFFKQTIQQQFFYIFILIEFQYFLPLITIPFFAYYAHKNLKSIK